MPSRLKLIRAEEVSAATAFGAPRNKFGDGSGHLGSAAAAWLGGVFVCNRQVKYCPDSQIF